MNIEELEVLHGNVKELLLPSKRRIVIREQNGNDDDVVSRVLKTDLSASYNNFISGIIVYDYTLKKNPTVTDILNYRLNDKYYAMIASRIFSLGKDLKFQYQWAEEDKPVEYIEDLEQYLGDYSKPLPTQGEPGYNPNIIPAYLDSDLDGIALTLTSGKEIRYEYLSGAGERYLLELNPDDRTVNKQLMARNLAYKPKEGDWHKVTNFKVFSSRDMAEIRKNICDNDIEFEGTTDIVNPKDNNNLRLPLISITDFFFPMEI